MTNHDGGYVELQCRVSNMDRIVLERGSSAIKRSPSALFVTGHSTETSRTEVVNHKRWCAMLKDILCSNGRKRRAIGLSFSYVLNVNTLILNVNLRQIPVYEVIVDMYDINIQLNIFFKSVFFYF